MSGRRSSWARRGTNDVIALRYAGRFANHSDDPSHFVFTGPITSMTGEVVGEMTHDVTCSSTTAPPCRGLDTVNTFRFADGTIVNRADESGAPDPQHPEHLLTGNHPSDESIISTTGVYAGRTGRAHMSGRHDASELPGFVTFDDFWLIELDD